MEIKYYNYNKKTNLLVKEGAKMKNVFKELNVEEYFTEEQVKNLIIIC